MMKKKRLVTCIMCFNLGIYAEKSLIDWEKIPEEEGTTHGGFKNSSNSRTSDLLYEISKL